MGAVRDFSWNFQAPSQRSAIRDTALMTNHRASPWRIGRIPTAFREARDKLVPISSSVSVIPVFAAVCRIGATSWTGARNVLATEARTNRPINHGMGTFLAGTCAEVVVGQRCVKP